MLPTASRKSRRINLSTQLTGVLKMPVKTTPERWRIPSPSFTKAFTPAPRTR